MCSHWFFSVCVFYPPVNLCSFLSVQLPHPQLLTRFSLQPLLLVICDIPGGVSEEGTVGVPTNSGRVFLLPFFLKRLSQERLLQKRNICIITSSISP